MLYLVPEEQCFGLIQLNVLCVIVTESLIQTQDEHQLSKNALI